MPITRRRWLAVVSVPFGLAALAGMIALSHAASGPLAVDDLRVEQARAQLSSLTHRLADVRACALRADVTAVFHKSSGLEDKVAIGQPIQGIFEYAASGDAWRKRSLMDAKLYPGMNTEIAFNGEFYQYAMLDHGVMTVSRSGDDKAPGVTLPNPLVALGQFVVPEHVADNDITLARLREACARADLAGAAWRMERVNDELRPVATFSGGMLHETPYVYKVGAPRTNDDSMVIERVLLNGTVILRSTFSDWRPVANAQGAAHPWPMRIHFEGFNPATGELAAEMSMTLEELRFPKQADSQQASDFLLDWDASRRVWLDEPGVFIK